MVARESAMAVFAIRYGWFRPLLSVLGAGPAFSRVEVEGDRVRVQMGPMFRADVPVASITEVERFRGIPGGIGVHGWRGQWLVNGSVRGIVSIGIDPPVRARVLGVPVKLRRLHVSVQSPEGLMAALGR
jgi:hypothetical protein